MPDKIIVTNSSALIAKYGPKGHADVQKAVKALIAADKLRGILTNVVHLDDAVAMKKMNGKAVVNATDPRENKNAIDAIFKNASPDYLMILGAVDVVPHQDLKNPVFEADVDDDRRAWGDIPYACDEPYSRDPANFVGPSRVVGRLPDLTRAREPSYLLNLLKIAANYKGRPVGDYARYFGLSADVWKVSTEMSLDEVFGNSSTMHLSPPSGPAFPKKNLQALAHFINCHGGLASPEFDGEGPKDTFQTALTTKSISGKIANGTIAAVECCYGAELYDSVTLGIDIPICQTYLKQGSYGYFGSTTIAYGPAGENGSADLICQYFLMEVLKGASIGRAALLARQRFVQDTAQMDPIDLKTVSQFCLLGDPSIHPVAKSAGEITPKGMAAAADASRFQRSERRVKLKQVGAFLKATKPTASRPTSLGKLKKDTASALANIALLAGLRVSQAFTAYTIKNAGKAARGVGKAKSASVPSRYLIAMGRSTEQKSSKSGRGIAVVAKELNGRIVDHRVYHQR